MLFYFSLGILILILGASLFWRRSFGSSLREAVADEAIPLTKRLLHFVRNDDDIIISIILKIIFLFSIILIFGLLFYQSYQQYQVWAQNDPSKFLLPPYQNIGYFIFYVGARFFAPYLISLTAAVLFFFSAKFFNKKYNERFFYSEELWLGALALFLTSWPGALFYFVSLILVYLIIHTSYFLIHNPSIRVSLYYLWLPTAIFVIIISKWLQALPFWQLLKL